LEVRVFLAAPLFSEKASTTGIEDQLKLDLDAFVVLGPVISQTH
jgi:hypothetical protein